MQFKVKRVYEAPDDSDGQRVLVDRLWPRGLKKEKARIDLWMKDLAPSEGLRKWFAHDPLKWGEFRARYFLELDSKASGLVNSLLDIARAGNVTLLFATREQALNNAVALKEYLENRYQ